MLPGPTIRIQIGNICPNMTSSLARFMRGMTEGIYDLQVESTYNGNELANIVENDASDI